MENNYWYATMKDAEDNDWGFGSYCPDQAEAIVRSWREGGYPDAYIAVIDESGNEPMCVDEIHDF